MSYARGDEGVVKTMARAFEAARREVWYDHDLDGGDIWWPTILDRIRSCHVFLFALSDNSLESRACLAELDYAEKLDRPVLPVRVGPVVKPHANPLATMQYVPFLVDDAVSAFAVLAAADRSAERCPPLPAPLPPEPPIPFAYLKQVTHQIDAGELTPSAQLEVIAELRRAIAEDPERSVRQEIVGILHRLLTKPWRTIAAGLEIQATLAAHRAMEEEIERLAGTPAEEGRQAQPDGGTGTAPTGSRDHAPDAEAHPGTEAHPDPEPDPTRARGRGPVPSPDPDPDLHPATGSSSAPDPGLDPEELFLARFEELDARGHEPGTDSTPASGPTQTPEEIFARRTEEVFGQLRAGAAVRQARESAVRSDADHEQPPAFSGVGHAESTIPWAAGQSARTGRPTEDTETLWHPEHTEQDDSPGHDEHTVPSAGTPPNGPPTAAAPPATAPPTRRALGVTGLVLSLCLGALAASTGGFLVVPFVVSAVTAVVALRFSTQVGRRFAVHDLDGARSASHTALVWAAVALALVAAVVGVFVLAAIGSMST